MSNNELKNWSKIPKWLKRFVLYGLPALGTLYFTLSGIWGIPYGEQILGTATAIQLCLGTWLGIKIKKEN